MLPIPCIEKMKPAGIISATNVRGYIQEGNFPNNIHFDGNKLSEKFTICFPGTTKIYTVLNVVTKFCPVVYFCPLKKEWIVGEWAYEYGYPKAGIVTHYAYVL